MTAELRGIVPLVIAAVEATDVLVGDGEQPAGSGWQGAPGASEFVPYVSVHPVPGGGLDGPLGAPHTDADVVVQLTCVGASRAQCELVADRARTATVGTHPVFDGAAVTLISIDTLAGARRDDTVEPAVWISTDRIRVHVTPDLSGS